MRSKDLRVQGKLRSETIRREKTVDRKNACRKTGKAKVDSEISVKAVNSAKRKCVEEVMNMGQGDDQFPGTDRKLTDLTMVPLILMDGLRSATYKT